MTAVARILNCNSEINRFIDDFPYEPNNGGAIFVHATIFLKLTEKLKSRGNVIPNENCCPYNLCLPGQSTYPMYLVWVDDDILKKTQMHMLIPESKYSMPWEQCISVYTTLDKFHLVEQFIDKFKLGKWLSNVHVDTSRACIEHDIKIAEFTDDMTTDYLPKFRKFLEQNDYEFPRNYFVTRAFKFLRPAFLKQYHETFNNVNITLVNVLLAKHRNNLNKGDELFNIFDLIAMKMSVDDIRFEQINCEFDKLVNCALKRFATTPKSYIKSQTLNLVDYQSDLGILTYSEEVYQYLVSQYCSNFHTIKAYDYGTCAVNLSRIQNIDAILASSNKIRKLIIQRTVLDEKNAYALMKILTYDKREFQPIIQFYLNNLIEVVETDLRMNPNIIHVLPSRFIKFKGKNDNFLVENLLNWMKFTLGLRWDNFDLRFIEIESICPFILQGIHVRMIVIKKVTITCKLLRALQNVNYQIIKLSKCYLENHPDIFLLMDRLPGERYIQINIDDDTWKTFMGTMANLMGTTGLREYRFKNYITIFHLHTDYEFIELSQFKFCLNDEGTHIQAVDLYTNKYVNLFDYFYKPDEASAAHEFYT